MDVADKKPRLIRPTPMLFKHKRLFIVGGAVIVLIVAGLIINNAVNKAHMTPSQKLIAQINTLRDGKHNCSEGLNQLKPDISSITKAGKYNNAAREAGLDYLMVCEFYKGNKQAVNYGNQLNALYVQDGNTVKERDLASFMKYMQLFGGQNGN